MKTEFNWKENYNNILEYATNKNKYTWWKLVLLGILGGMFIGIGYIGYIAIKASDPHGLSPTLTKFLAAGIFPVGLILVVILGGSIFTSESLSSLAFLNKKTTLKDLFKGWGIIWASNFVGAALMAFVVWWSHIFNSADAHKIIVHMVKSKAGLEWYITLGSAIICNLIVAGAVWLSMASKQMISKIFLLWFPITLFVLSGTQHVVANMFAFSLGWMEAPGGFDTFNAIFQNLLPATIGNWIAGAIILPGVYTLLHIKTKKEIEFESKKEIKK